jgi:hypothetical protein
MSSPADATLTLPKRLDLDGALSAAAALRALPAMERYRLDFSEIKFVEPFGMLFFATVLRQFRRCNSMIRFVADGYKQHHYPAHMGFFKAFGLDFGKEPGEAAGNTQYVPITPLAVEELRREAINNHEDERETIERRAIGLATLLTRQDFGPLQETLSYSLREIFRNVLEHSGADTIWYTAQYWPEKCAVELCILDEGIGIGQSLRRNPHLTVQSDHDAIDFALLPGISGVAFRGGPKQRKDPWANSGYGLFMTSQLCRRGGSFVAISGNGGVRISEAGEERLDCRMDGTAIRLQLQTDRIGSLGASLEELRNLGAKIAGDLRQEANITASLSSRMLFGSNGNSRRN